MIEDSGKTVIIKARADSILRFYRTAKTDAENKLANNVLWKKIFLSAAILELLILYKLFVINYIKNEQKQEIKEVAKNFGIEPAMFLAFIEVESGGKGFDDATGKIIIQFEPVWF